MFSWIWDDTEGFENLRLGIQKSFIGGRFCGWHLKQAFVVRISEDINYVSFPNSALNWDYPAITTTTSLKVSIPVIFPTQN